MTTSELLEDCRNIAKADAIFHKDDAKVSLYVVLVDELCDRLEEDEKILERFKTCEHCQHLGEGYRKGSVCEVCWDADKFEWSDEE